MNEKVLYGELLLPDHVGSIEIVDARDPRIQQSSSGKLYLTESQFRSLQIVLGQRVKVER